jgi:hypothetical protein
MPYLAGTPYRMGYMLEEQNSSTTTFNFNLAAVDTALSSDFDGLDFDMGSPVG